MKNISYYEKAKSKPGKANEKQKLVDQYQHVDNLLAACILYDYGKPKEVWRTEDQKLYRAELALILMELDRIIIHPRVD
jgi:hypothetical protein